MIDRAPDITISIPGPFKGKGRHRSRVQHGAGGRFFVRQHSDPATAKYEAVLRHFGVQAMKTAGIAAPIDGAIWVNIEATFLPPDSWSKRKREAALAGTIEPTVKPDSDNVAKVIGDGLNGIVWSDDKNISRCSIAKTYGLQEGLRVEVWRRGE